MQVNLLDRSVKYCCEKMKQDFNNEIMVTQESNQVRIYIELEGPDPYEFLCYNITHCPHCGEKIEVTNT